MRRASLVSVLLAAVAVAVGGCNRKTDFLHHIIPEPPPALTEITFPIKELQGDNKIDVLWIIDNSGSMGEEQASVVRNTSLFLQEFTKKSYLDWRLGLISTDQFEQPYIGLAPPYLDKAVADPVAAFQTAVRRLGLDGDPTEMVFTPVLKTLTAFPAFLRPGAMLALIMITDAIDQSWSVSAQQFIDGLKLSKGDLKRILLYGAFSPTDWGCTDGDSSWQYKNSKYEQVFTALNGKTYLLCRDDFGTDLADLSKDIVKRVSNPRLPLKLRPLISSLKVLHKGQSLPGGLPEEGGFWLYDFHLNAIIFHNLDFAPDENESVTIQMVEDVGQ